MNSCVSMADRTFLLHLQRRGLRYFLDNQAANGLVLDRQSNRGRLRSRDLCSTAATGMGLIALALASTEPHRLIARGEAVRRVCAALRTALETLPHEEGMVPHFVHAHSGEVYGFDVLSTVETGWLAAGALWSGSFLEDTELQDLATRLYERIDWWYWTAPERPDARGLLRHGKGRDADFLPCCWDRLNGETVFLYVLAAGAETGRALPCDSWTALRPFYGEVAGHRFHSADLGLFVFQYGLDLLDLERWLEPGGLDLAAEARLATLANQRACAALATRYTTYRRHWGLSAGDGPGQARERDIYRAYAPSGPVDGTAHLTAALTSVAHAPGEVLDNLRTAPRDAWGRYGLSNLNLDRGWIGNDLVGIDAGAAVMALDNYLAADRVRRVFHELPCVRRALQRLDFTFRQPLRLAS